MDGLFKSGTDDRWDHAARRAQGLADYGVGPVLRRYFTVYFPIGLVALIATGAVITEMVFRDDVEWPESLSGGILLAGIGVLISGLVYNARRIAPTVEAGRIGVVMSLRDDERRASGGRSSGKNRPSPNTLW